MYAFRCKSCGHFEPSAHAGECLHPHSCVACGAGVSFNPKTGTKIFDPENWEILADCLPERITQLGLDDIQVVRHEPCFAEKQLEPKHISLQANECVGAQNNA